MKKLITFICMTIILLSMPVTVPAGDVPEGLLSNDEAQVFFGEVLAYHSGENPTVTVCPVKKIKGEVSAGTQQHYYDAHPVGNFKVKQGNIYLFTCFDENNPTNIFEVTSYETSELKIKNTDFDIWKRFEQYLNDGEYEKAEQDRINRINALLTEVGDEITLSALLETKKEDCNKIEIGLFGKAEIYEIDKELFYKTANKIRLTDIENTLIINPDNGLVIRCYESGNVHEVTIWEDCKVAGRRTSHISAPTGDYIIKAEDYKSLASFLPEDVQPKLPPLKNLYANFIYWFIYNSTTAYIIGILILLAGGAGFIFANKKRKKD